MIEEATVDCYGDDEATGGFAATLEDRVRLPFATQVLGVPVQVVAIEQSEAGDIVAICVSGRHRQSIPLLALPLPNPPPAGVEWIAAYRHWRGG